MEETSSLTPIEKGNHDLISEDWFLDNLPPDWTYDCYMGEPWGFLIYPPQGEPLFIPLDLLKKHRDSIEVHDEIE